MPNPSIRERRNDNFKQAAQLRDDCIAKRRGTSPRATFRLMLWERAGEDRGGDGFLTGSAGLQPASAAAMPTHGNPFVCGPRPSLRKEPNCLSRLLGSEETIISSRQLNCEMIALPRGGGQAPALLLDNRCESELARTKAEIAFSLVAQVCNLRPPPTCPRTGTHFVCTSRLPLRTDYGAGFARK